MFDKLKQIKKLRNLQNELSKEKIIIEKDGINIRINGKMEIEYIAINPELEKSRHEKVLRDCFNDAIKKIQIKVAEQMQKMGSLGDLGL